VITIVVVFVIAALLAALGQLIGDEVRGWLELVPRAILRLAAVRLPVVQRPAIYNEEWFPELLSILREAEGRPITRLITGTWFAASMIRAAGRVGRELNGVRGGEPKTRIVELHDAGAGVDNIVAAGGLELPSLAAVLTITTMPGPDI